MEYNQNVQNWKLTLHCWHSVLLNLQKYLWIQWSKLKEEKLRLFWISQLLKSSFIFSFLLLFYILFLYSCELKKKNHLLKLIGFYILRKKSVFCIHWQLFINNSIYVRPGGEKKSMKSIYHLSMLGSWRKKVNLWIQTLSYPRLIVYHYKESLHAGGSVMFWTYFLVTHKSWLCKCSVIN